VNGRRKYFSIFDKKLNKWNEETILKDPKAYGNAYITRWYSNNLHTKTGFFSNTMQIFGSARKDLLAEVRTRKPWIGEVKFEIKIYSNQYPDAISFFLMAIDDHRTQIAAMDR
jgi:hypothetical protein